MLSGGSQTIGWEHWDVPLGGLGANAKLRFTTDSYTRAMDRNSPTWKWAIWGRRQVGERVLGGVHAFEQAPDVRAERLEEQRALGEVPRAVAVAAGPEPPLPSKTGSR